MKLNEKRQIFRRGFLQFKTEEEVEKVVVDNFMLLFGDYSILLPKSKILTSGGKGTIPDGIIVDFKEKPSEKWVADIGKIQTFAYN